MNNYQSLHFGQKLTYANTQMDFFVYYNCQLLRSTSLSISSPRNPEGSAFFPIFVLGDVLPIKGETTDKLIIDSNFHNSS